MSVPVVRFTVRGHEATVTASGRPYTIVYDGDCRVCLRLVAWVRAHDRDRCFEALPYQNPAAAARFPWIPPDAFARAVQLIGPGGRTWQGAEAVAEILRQLPRWRWTAPLFRWPVVGPLLEAGYRWFARHRYRFGCGHHCARAALEVRFEPEENDRR